MRLIIKILTSKIFILSSVFAGLTFPKLSSAATSARLAVSAIVMTRCNIKVISLANGKVNTDSTCSDDTRPTVVFNAEPAAVRKDTSEKATETAGIGRADVTVTY